MLRSPLALVGAVLLLSCQKSEIPEPDGLEGRQFGAAEKTVAKALSIGNHADLDRWQNPFDRAVRCVIAVASINALFDGGRSLPEEQARAIDRVLAFYRQDAAEHGREAGFSETEIEEKFRTAQDEFGSTPKDATVAIACLERLREP